MDGTSVRDVPPSALPLGDSDGYSEQAGSSSPSHLQRHTDYSRLGHSSPFASSTVLPRLVAPWMGKVSPLETGFDAGGHLAYSMTMAGGADGLRLDSLSTGISLPRQVHNSASELGAYKNHTYSMVRIKFHPPAAW